MPLLPQGSSLGFNMPLSPAESISLSLVLFYHVLCKTLSCCQFQRADARVGEGYSEMVLITAKWLNLAPDESELAKCPVGGINYL